ncbi:MAG: ComEC/Rec2 family competence protein [Candidatus Diapherotrites archaeon]
MKGKIALLAILLAVLAIAAFFYFSQAERGSAPNVVPNSFDGNLRVWILDVNQGDSILLQLPNGKNILVDAGLPEQGEKVAAFLKQQGVYRLDALVATHSDSDHIGGMDEVLKQILISAFFENGRACETQTCKGLDEVLGEKQIPRAVLKGGTDFNIGGFSFSVLNPWPEDSQTDNDASIVLRFAFKNEIFMLAGDCTSLCEQTIEAHFIELDVNVLKVGHHGSAYSSSAPFLQRVSPQFALISVGENSYGHPPPQTIQRLQESGATVLRTDKSGNIELNTDGEILTISHDN